MVEDMTTRLRKMPQLVLDSALAVALTLVGWALLAVRPVFEPRGGGLRSPGIPPGDTQRIIAAGPFGPTGSPSPWAYVVTALGVLPLALRDRFPLTVLAITSVVAASTRSATSRQGLTSSPRSSQCTPSRPYAIGAPW